MIKLIVSDMDGTLITHQGRISKGNLEAIHHGQKHGARLVIATGRDFSSIDKIMHDHGLSCMAILGNGAQFANRFSLADLVNPHYKINDGAELLSV